MILYNVTINIDDEVHDQWVQWMQQEHIPDVLHTGLFRGHRFMKVLSRFDEETGTTYSIQYFLDSMEDYIIYRDLFAPALQQKHNALYEGKYMAFRTLLEDV